MKKLKYILIMASVMYLLIGCNNNNPADDSPLLSDFQNPSEQRTMEGVIYKGNEGTWLVEEETNINIEGYNLEKIRQEYLNVIKLNTDMDELNLGDKVKIWYDYIRESNPSKTNVLKYDRLID